MTTNTTTGKGKGSKGTVNTADDTTGKPEASTGRRQAMSEDWDFTTDEQGQRVPLTNETWPNNRDRCYDCGSTIPGHHTPLCEMAPEGAVRDLPAKPGTQWWDRDR